MSKEISRSVRQDRDDVAKRTYPDASDQSDPVENNFDSGVCHDTDMFYWFNPVGSSCMVGQKSGDYTSEVWRTTDGVNYYKAVN